MNEIYNLPLELLDYLLSVAENEDPLLRLTMSIVSKKLRESIRIRVKYLIRLSIITIDNNNCRWICDYMRRTDTSMTLKSIKLRVVGDISCSICSSVIRDYNSKRYWDNRRQLSIYIELKCSNCPNIRMICTCYNCRESNNPQYREPKYCYCHQYYNNLLADIKGRFTNQIRDSKCKDIITIFDKLKIKETIYYRDI